MEVSGKALACLFGQYVGMSEEDMKKALGEEEFNEAQKEVVEKQLYGKNIIVD